MAVDPNKDMHLRSGAVHDNDPLVALFYDLLRDHIQPGDLEKLIRDACDGGVTPRVYSNGWLASYAKDIVARLDDARLEDVRRNKHKAPVLETK